MVLKKRGDANSPGTGNREEGISRKIVRQRNPPSLNKARKETKDSPPKKDKMKLEISDPTVIFILVLLSFLPKKNPSFFDGKKQLPCLLSSTELLY